MRGGYALWRDRAVGVSSTWRITVSCAMSRLPAFGGERRAERAGTAAHCAKSEAILHNVCVYLKYRTNFRC